MREHSSFRQGQKKSEERKKLVKTAAIPLIVVVLMLVIVVAERGKRAGTSANVPESDLQTTGFHAEQEAQSGAALEAEKENSGLAEEVTEKDADSEIESEASSKGTEEFEISSEAEESVLQKDAVPEVLSLMKEYYQARATGDAELLNKLYGIEGLSVSELEAEKTRMRSNSKYLRSFDNIVTYVAEGLTEREWLVYSTCNMHFHATDAAVPMIMWCYVVQQEDGTLLIQKPEELSAEVRHHIEVVNRSQEVRSLASEINVQLKEVLTENAELNEIYGVLRDGSPVYEGTDAQARGAVQILEESEEAVLESEMAAEEAASDEEPEVNDTETNPEAISQ